MAENDNTASPDLKEPGTKKKWQKLHSISSRLKNFFKDRIDTEGSSSRQSKLIYIALALVLIFSWYLVERSEDISTNTMTMVSAGFNELTANDSVMSSSINQVSANFNGYRSYQDSTNISMGESLKAAMKGIDKNSEEIRQAKNSISAMNKRIASLERHVNCLDTIDKYTIRAIDKISGGEAFRYDKDKYDKTKNDTLHKAVSRKQLKIVSKKQ